MKSVPATRAKPRLFAVLPAVPREVQALEEFIALKERQINRLVRVDENLDAILETEWLKDYIFTCSNRDRSGATMLPFWPKEIMTNEGVNPREQAPQVSTEAGTADECGPVPIELPVDPLVHLPDVQLRGYLVPATTYHLEQAGQTSHGRPHVHGWEQ